MAKPLSSTSQTDLYPHLSKDGLFYKTYQDMVEANKRHNNKILKEKGLDAESFKAMINQHKKAIARSNKKTAKRSVSYNSSEEEEVASNSNFSDDTNSRLTRGQKRQLFLSSSKVTDENGRRRSTRLSMKQEQEKTVSVGTRSTTDSLTKIKRKDDINDDDDEVDNDSVDVIIVRPPKQRRRLVSTNTKKNVLVEEERIKLRTVPKEKWLYEMDQYLSNIENISDDNKRNVMNQVTKLVNGIGVSYHHWSTGTLFYKRTCIHLAMDFDELYNEAVDFEDKHGRDLGNGWLLRHPIKKLSNFQSYYYSEVFSTK